MIDTVLTLILVILVIKSILLIIKNFRKLYFERYLVAIPIVGFTQLLHTQILCFVMPEYCNPATNYIVVFYMIVEYVFIQAYLLHTLHLNKIKSFGYAIILPSLLLIGEHFNQDHISNWYFIYILCETALIIISSLLVISQSILDDNKKNLLKDSEFIFSSGILITFIYLMPFYAIRNFLLINIDLYVKIQTLNIVLGYCIFYSSIIYSIKWKIKQLN